MAKDVNKIKNQKRIKRAKRTRSKILGSAKRPRLSVFRSNKHIYAQLINDEKSATLASASDLDLKSAGKNKKMELAAAVGQLIAKKAAELKIDSVIFDKGGYKYHGIIKTLADSAREGGLKF